MQGWIVRNAEVGDAAEICEVLRKSVYGICAPDYDNDETLLAEWCANKTPENVASWFGYRGNHTFVAQTTEGKILGVGLLDQSGEVLLCYVLPEALHTGVGKSLLARMEANARERGLTEMRACSTISALPFYERNGFKVLGPESPGEKFSSFQMIRSFGL